MLQIEGLSYRYKLKQALDNIAFTVQEHEIVAVLGPNGAGKSTLLKCINRLLVPGQGTIRIGGKDTRRLTQRELARQIGYVAQHNEAARFTVFDAVLLGRHPHIEYRIAERDLRMVNGILERLSLQELALRYLDQLSGGELQKVCLARALVQEPGLLLLDEPTSSLDLKNQVEILRLVRKIADGHAVSVVMSLHDINLAIHYADRIVFLKEGKIFASCRKEALTREIIREVYGIDVVVHNTGDYPVVIPVPY